MTTKKITLNELKNIVKKIIKEQTEYSYILKNLINKYQKKYGYKPSIGELYDLYNQGELILSDVEEDSLIKAFEDKGLR
jgi:hypothetical protein